MCLLKIVRVNEILRIMIRYEVILRTILDVFHLIKDIIGVLLVFLAIMASLMLSLFGGMLNDSFESVWTEYTTVGFPGAIMNYNDFSSAYIKLIIMVFTNFNACWKENVILMYHLA